jgi:hypothetical protein
MILETLSSKNRLDIKGLRDMLQNWLGCLPRFQEIEKERRVDSWMSSGAWTGFPPDMNAPL